MLLLESFLVRRLLIGRATAGLNRALRQAVPAIRDEDRVDEALHLYLSTGRKYFAADVEVKAALTTFPSISPADTPSGS